MTDSVIFDTESEPSEGEPFDDKSGYFDETTPSDSHTDDKGEEKKPTPHKARKSASDLLTMVVGGVGTGLVHSGRDIPVGRVLQFEAPLAGNKFDQLIENTWVDSLIQPFVSRADIMQEVGALMLFPLLVGVYERNPSTAPVVEPILREVIHSVLVDMAPVIRKRKSEERRAAKSMADISEMFDLAPGENPIDAVLASIFSPVEPPPTEGEPPA